MIDCLCLNLAVLLNQSSFMLLKNILYLRFSLSPYSAAHMNASQILFKMETFLGINSPSRFYAVAQ